MKITPFISTRAVAAGAAVLLGATLLSGAASIPPDAAARGLGPSAAGSYTCPIDTHVRLTVKVSAPSAVRFYNENGPNAATPLYTSPAGATTAVYTYNSRSVSWAVGANGQVSFKSIGESCVP